MVFCAGISDFDGLRILLAYHHRLKSMIEGTTEFLRRMRQKICPRKRKAQPEMAAEMMAAATRI